MHEDSLFSVVSRLGTLGTFHSSSTGYKANLDMFQVVSLLGNVTPEFAKRMTLDVRKAFVPLVGSCCREDLFELRDCPSAFQNDVDVPNLISCALPEMKTPL